MLDTVGYALTRLDQSLRLLVGCATLVCISILLDVLALMGTIAQPGVSRVFILLAAMLLLLVIVRALMHLERRLGLLGRQLISSSSVSSVSSSPEISVATHSF